MNRQFYHDLMDQAMDATPEGESFVGKFVNLVILSTREGKTGHERLPGRRLRSRHITFHNQPFDDFTVYEARREKEGRPTD